jgi:HD superfamily phosphohydrolase YqeK
MYQSQMILFYNWFDQYVASFYTGNMDVDVNYRLKQEHIKRVTLNCSTIAKSLELDHEDTLIAESIGLFHDVGRFAQYRDYKTFSDAKTGSHALIGIKVLQEAALLSCFSSQEQQVIYDSIEYHNLLKIPENIPERTLLFSRLIRDADKLDAFYFLTDKKETRTYNLDQPAEEDLFSEKVIESVLQCRSIDFKDVITYCDRKLLEISLVYDLNFDYSKQYVIQNKYIEKLIEHLPESKEKTTVIAHINSYLLEQEEIIQ